MLLSMKVSLLKRDSDSAKNMNADSLPMTLNLLRKNKSQKLSVNLKRKKACFSCEYLLKAYENSLLIRNLLGRISCTFALVKIVYCPNNDGGKSLQDFKTIK